ncbi:MAG: FAD binding domain-containing protein [Planctomycetes bacterium]|nr:FAD binding domain-containing protein [Planctomycetota bacterium]
MTMLLPQFELSLPKSVDEAIALMAKFGPENADWLAGGSDLLCNYKWGLNTKPNVIGLGEVQELKSISPTRIGALTTLREIATNEVLGKKLPCLPYVAKKIASVLIQEQATLGGNLMLDTRCHFFNQSYLWRRGLGYCLKAEGNLCHVIPKIKRDGVLVDNSFECVATNSSDFAPLLIALGAELEFASRAGSRRVKLADFYTYDGITRYHLEAGELLVAIHIPESAQTLKAGYKKLRPRESFDFPVLGVAASLRKDSSGKLEHLSLCINAVHPHPHVFDELCGKYLGSELTPESIDEIAAAVRKEINPKLNVPMEPGYRRKMSEVFVRRLLSELWAE